MDKRAIAERLFLTEKLRAAAESIGVPYDENGQEALMWVASEVWGLNMIFEDCVVNAGRALVSGASLSRSRLHALVSLGFASLIMDDGTLQRPDEFDPLPPTSDIREISDFAFLVGMAVAAVNECLEMTEIRRNGGKARADAYAKRSDDVLAIWRREVDPKLPADTAAAKLHGRVSLSFRKVSDLIRAEQKALRAKQSGNDADSTQVTHCIAVFFRQ